MHTNHTVTMVGDFNTRIGHICRKEHNFTCGYSFAFA